MGMLITTMQATIVPELQKTRDVLHALKVDAREREATRTHHANAMEQRLLHDLHAVQTTVSLKVDEMAATIAPQYHHALSETTNEGKNYKRKLPQPQLPVSRSLPGNGTGGSVTTMTTKNPPNKKASPNKKTKSKTKSITEESAATATGNVPIPTDSVIYLGAERLNNALTNMEQAIHTQLPIADEHFLRFDSNPEGNTANKLIRMLRHNNGNGQYGTCVFSIDEELKFTCAFAVSIIGACGAPITKLIPLSEMVVYCHTNGLYELVSFFKSIETLIDFGNAILQLVPKLTAVVNRGTPNADRNIMMQVLQDFFPRLGGENHDYKPTRLQPGVTKESRIKMVSARMITASIYLPNGKMNIVCNQMYHNQISEQDRNICQRMNQSTTSREPGNITLFLDFPRQPFTVRAAASDIMNGRQPTIRCPKGELYKNECCVEDCNHPRFSPNPGVRFCKHHRDPKTRCAKCKRRGLPDGSENGLCSTCDLLCRKKGCEKVFVDGITKLCSDCNTRCHRCNVNGIEKGGRTIFCSNCNEIIRNNFSI